MSAAVQPRFGESGIEFHATGARDWLRHPECLAPESQPLAAYLAQLEDEGYATQEQDCLSIAWEDLYRKRPSPPPTPLP